MDSLLFRDRLTLAAVLGAGVVIGVSSVYVYLKYSRTISHDLNHLTRTIEHLDKEIQELKSSKWVPTNLAPSSGQVAFAAATSTSSSCSVKSKRRSSSGAESNGSHIGSSEDNDEYYDVAEENEINRSWASLNGEVVSSSKDEDMDQLFEKVDRLFVGDADQQQEAYDILLELKEEHEGNAGLMWRLAMACYQLSTIADDADKKKQLVFEGLKYGTVAIAVDETLGEAHKWYAALLGKATDYYGIQEKIKNGFTFKEHVDTAIRYLPQDRGLYFMRGRWCYEVSMLSWVERKVASTLFATPPSSTLTEAREQFLEVERLFPKQWKENLLCIAKCFIGERNYSESIRWLEEARDLECKNSEEKEVHAEVLSLLKKYESYREK